MTPETQTVFAILGALVIWTGTVAGVVIWLDKRFDDVKEFVRTQIKAHSEDTDKEIAVLENDIKDLGKEIDMHGLRLVKVEMFTDPRIVPTYPLHGKS